MTEREKQMIGYIDYLLDYNRRIAQRQLVRGDWEKLDEIRDFLKETKKENNDG